MNIRVHPRKVFDVLLCLILIMLLANCIGIISKFHFHHGRIFGLVPLFDFDNETNIPAFYSALSLILASVLLAVIGLAHKRQGFSYRSWFVLGAIFFFLSVDEIASIHECLTVPIRNLLNTSGLLWFAWVIPYGVALIVFVMSYCRFLLRLPKETMILFVASGATFVSGAIGFELLGGMHEELYGHYNPTYALFYTCEELLEMLGIAIFLYALLSYMAGRREGFSITIAYPGVPRSATDPDRIYPPVGRAGGTNIGLRSTYRAPRKRLGTSANPITS